jgi:polysaccharide export outer membrane protein
MKFQFNRTFTLSCLLIILLTSCTGPKRLIYFSKQTDANLIILNKKIDPIIQTGDILTISISSLDEASSGIFNSASFGIQGVQQGGGGFGSNTGILVGLDSNINYPRLGKIKVVGKTVKELIDELEHKLLPYLKDPIVNIRFQNFRINVLGEVNRVGMIPVSNQQISILEAIASSGDITIFGNRKNVTLIRDSSGIRQFHRLDLTNKSIFESPYFYLQNNDILYVEPIKTKAIASSEALLLLPTVVSAFTFFLLVLNQLGK